MDVFHWNSCFITGLDNVDEQHQRLVELVNRLGEMVVRPEDITKSDLDTLFGELARYAQYHFAEESRLMERHCLDPRHIESHDHSHEDFLAEVTRMYSNVSVENMAAAKRLLDFLTRWLAYHILGSDRMMAKQIAAIAAGQSPVAAYQASLHSADSATDTLLEAVNGLFKQVSERNRELEQANKTLEVRVEERTQALRIANQQLEDLANTDILTKLPNRRFALSAFTKEWANSSANNTPLSCMMIDADGFKIINDTYGHDAGDTVLAALSRELKAAVHTDDIVCRLGGDEFLIICPNTPLDGVLTLANKVRAQINQLCVPAGRGEWKGSVSVGVAARDDVMQNLDALIKAADEGVYIAKHNGRNCVGCVAISTPVAVL